MKSITRINKADLIRLMACAQDDEQKRQAFANILGFEPITVEPLHKPDVEDAKYPEPEMPREPASRPEQDRSEPQPVFFWRASSGEFHPQESRRSVPDWLKTAEIMTREKLIESHRGKRIPEMQLLMPWARLWPFIKRRFSRLKPVGPVNIPRYVSLVAQGKLFRRLPRQMRLRRPEMLSVIMDRSELMRPFCSDMDRLVKGLIRMWGKERIKTFVLPFGITQKGFVDDSDDLKALTAKAVLPMGSHGSILVFSDLGALSQDPDTVNAWRCLGEQIRETGIFPVALIPCPPQMWTMDMTPAWSCIYWDRGRKPVYQKSQRVHAGSLRRDWAEKQRQENREQFFRLMSPVVRPDPELVRAMRGLLPVLRTDAAMEIEILQNWSRIAAFQNGFAGSFLPTVRKRVLDLVEEYHGFLPEIRDMEKTILKRIDPCLYPLIDTDKINARYVLTMYQQNFLAAGFSEAELIGWFRRMEQYLPAEAYADERIAALWVLAHKSDDDTLDTEDIPASITQKIIAWVLKPVPEKDYCLRQKGHDLLAAHLDGSFPVENSEVNQPGSSLGNLTTATQELFVAFQSDAGKKWKRRWPLQKPMAGIFKPETSIRKVTVEFDTGQLRLERIECPDWMESIGRDAVGLFGVTKDQKLNLRWVEPGPIVLHLFQGDIIYHINNGFWMRQAWFERWQNYGFEMPLWADRMGVDEYGIFAEFSVESITQRMRWIFPGEFMMGSPEDEPERSNDEIQHLVILTEGFWLADTACTQALWTAVMGKNHSYFKGDDRPVEEVSWDDCQVFMEKINNRIPGLKLPTEAQWEYACRAGTGGPFSFGGTITPDQVNYDGNYPYNNGNEGIYRAETVPVKSLPCNPWGLHEMHGNVFEWCRDRYGEYSSKPLADPEGAKEGSHRVVRGGSWDDDAGRCRSASRYWVEPGLRYSLLGFRFSRGHLDPVETGPASQKKEAPEMTPRSGVTKGLKQLFKRNKKK